MASTLQSKVNAEWGEAKGFYWNGFLEEVGNYLLKEKQEEEEDVISVAPRQCSKSHERGAIQNKKKS